MKEAVTLLGTSICPGMVVILNSPTISLRIRAAGKSLLSTPRCTMRSALSAANTRPNSFWMDR